MPEPDMDFVVTYRDGTVVHDLDFQRSMELFLEAQQTSNPAVITIANSSYKAP